MDPVSSYEPCLSQYLTRSDERYFRRVFKMLSRHRNPVDMRVLDVGCGAGIWVRYLRRLGIEARGIEPSTDIFDRYLRDDAAAVEHDIFQCTTIDSYSGSAPNIITCIDVIEHVSNPADFLAGMARILSPGGHLFISTPENDSLLSQVAGPHWHHMHRHHISLFSRGCLEREASKHDLQRVWFGHPAFFRSLEYSAQFAADFLRTTIPLPRWAKGIPIPANLGDVMALCFVRSA